MFGRSVEVVDATFVLYTLKSVDNTSCDVKLPTNEFVANEPDVFWYVVIGSNTDVDVETFVLQF